MWATREKFYTAEPVMKDVTKEEFDAFLEAYPRKLFFDAYAVCEPPFCSYNDFQLANRWPYSVVAEYSAAWRDDPAGKWRVMVNYEEVFASKTGYEEE